MDILMDMVIMDIMERERQRLRLKLLLSQDTTTTDTAIMAMVIMVIMERERLRLNQVITTMGIPIMVDMVTMDIMARGKLRQLLLLSLVTTIMDTAIMAMVDMVIMVIT